MPGKVLQTAGDSGLMKSVHRPGDHSGSGLRITAESPGADHGIPGIGVDIRHRGEIQRKPQFCQIAADGAAHSFGIVRIAGRSHRGRVPVFRQVETGGVCQTGDIAALLIHRNQQRQPAGGLPGCYHVPALIGGNEILAKKYDPTHRIAFQSLCQSIADSGDPWEIGIINSRLTLGKVKGVRSNQKQLSHFFFQSHCFQPGGQRVNSLRGGGFRQGIRRGGGDSGGGTGGRFLTLRVFPAPAQGGGQQRTDNLHGTEPCFFLFHLYFS